MGVPGPGRGRDRRLLLQPARLGGLRPGVQRREPPRLGTRARCATCWPAWTRSSPTGSPTRIASGVTGGSYGGYLTNWIVGHDQRFRAAMTCRWVSDMSILFTTGDISGGDWAAARVRVHAVGRTRPTTARSRRSPTPTGSGRRCSSSIPRSDIRTTIAQAEALFTVLRSLPPAGPPAARARGDARADALRDAVSAGSRTCAIVERLVPPLPGRRQARHAAAPQGPRRPLSRWRLPLRSTTNGRKALEEPRHVDQSTPSRRGRANASRITPSTSGCRPGVDGRTLAGSAGPRCILTVP